MCKLTNFLRNIKFYNNNVNKKINLQHLKMLEMINRNINDILKTFKLKVSYQKFPRETENLSDES